MICPFCLNPICNLHLGTYRVFEDQVDLSEAIQFRAPWMKMLKICFLNFSSWYNFARTLKTPFVLKKKSNFLPLTFTPKNQGKVKKKMENRQKWLKMVKNDKNKMSKMVKNWNFLHFWHFLQLCLSEKSMKWTKIAIFCHFYFCPFCFYFLGVNLRGQKIRFFVK